MQLTEQHLQSATQSIKDISNLLDNKIIANDERQTLLVTYFDICMEHISSIHILISNRIL